MRNASPSLARVVVLIALAALAVGILLALSGGSPTLGATDSSAEASLRGALERARAARSYRYTSEVDQALVPRPLPSMIGQSDQHLRLVIEGEVAGRDRSRTQLRLDTSGVSGLREVAPVTIVRDGAELYAEQSGERIPLRPDSALSTPTDDVLDYLAAAERPRWLAPQAIGGASQGGIAFDLRGPRLVEILRARLLAAHPGAVLSIPEAYEHASGDGELWLDASGLPVRQVIRLELPFLSPEYHGRMEMRQTYDGFVGATAGVVGGWGTEGQGDKATAGRGGWGEALGRHAPAIAGLAILGVAALLVLALHRRSPRGANLLLSSLVIVSLVAAPALQADAAGRRAQLPTVDSLLGLAPARPDPPEVAAALARIDQGLPVPAGTVRVCGDGRADTDSDGDQLSDLDEGCLGTNAYDEDSDGDLLPDSLEVAKFTLGGREWSTNPLKADSNDDGLNDFLELPRTPVKMTLNNTLTSVEIGAAPTRPGSPPQDWDRDGLPNLWDGDNDGDGVPDSVDLSPFAVGSYQSEFRVSASGDYTGTLYLEFQIQPEQRERLRYGLSLFDWPANDTQGTMRNYVGNARVRLQPYLEVTINDAAVPRAYADEYRPIIRDEAPQPGFRTVLIPLQPTGEGGAIDAFYGKAAFAPAELRSIDWRGRLVWLVQGDSQGADGKTQGALLNVYRGDKIRVAGLRLSKSRQAESLILGEPGSPNEDQRLIAAATGMRMFFLSAGTIPTATVGLSPLQELAARFNTPNTAQGLRFNIPASVTMPARFGVQPHGDAALKDLGVAVGAYLNGNRFLDFYDRGGARCNDGQSSAIRCASLLVAMDERTGSASQEELRVDVAADQGFERYNVNLGAIVESRRQSLKLAMYEFIGGEWRTLSTGRALAIVANRYTAQRPEIEQLLRSRGLPQTWDDVRGVIFGAYMVNLQGSSATQTAGQPPALDESDGIKAVNALLSLGSTAGGLGRGAADLFEVFAAGGNPFKLALPALPEKPQPARAPGGPPAYQPPPNPKQLAKIKADRLIMPTNTFAAGFGFFQGGASLLALAVSIASASCDPRPGSCDENAMKGAVKGAAVVGSISAVGDMALKFVQVAVALKTGTTVKNILPAITVASKAGIASAALAGIGAAFTAGVLIAELVLTLQAVQGQSTLYVKQAAVSFVVQFIFAAFLLFLQFIPGVGQILSAILALIDALVAVITIFTGDETSLAKELVKFFYNVKVGTSLGDTSFSPAGDSGPADPSRGLTAGNTYVLAQSFSGRIDPSGEIRRYRPEWLAQSSVAGSFDLPAGVTGQSVATLPSSCWGAEFSFQQCANRLEARFDLKAGINQPFSFRTKIRYNYNLHACYLAGLICDPPEVQRTDLGDKDDKGNPTPFNVLYLDVLPATLGEFVTWNIYNLPQGGAARWNLDLDGDTLLNREEIGGLRADLWDSDGDTVSDGFEQRNEMRPLLADGDNDGLRDADELRVGTRFGKPDSDGDGLTDGEELSAQRGPAADSFALGGWEIALPSGRVARVFSDPLYADSDGDGLFDGAERAQATSPWAFNGEPSLDLFLSPYGASPDGQREGAVVRPGDQVTITLGLGNFSGRPVDGAMTLCLPSQLVEVQGGDLAGSGRRPQATTGPCPGGTQRSWSFATPNALIFAERVETTLTARVDPALGASQELVVSASVPGRKAPIELRRTIYVDADAPTAAITSLQQGEVIRRPPGGATLIVGGTSADATSWTRLVELDAGSGFAAATNTSPWSFAWALPQDGVYTLRARATDAVGRTGLSEPVGDVIVDGTPPTGALGWSGVRFVRPAADGSVLIEGSAADNLAGLQRIDVSVDGKAFVGAQFTPGRSSAWSYRWQLTSVALAQGAHEIRLRVFDRAGNVSEIASGRLVVDGLPPTSDLVTGQFRTRPLPVLPAGQPVAVAGRANEAGYQPLPPGIDRLEGAVDTLDNATVFYAADAPADDSAGVTLAWAGDLDGDRRADFVVGLPGAASGAGRVNVVYGRGGDLRAPPNMELLRDSRASLVGAAGAGLGRSLAPAGDVNGDAFDDLLVGDPASQRAFLVFGRPTPLGPEVALDGPQSGTRTVLALPLAGGQQPVLAAAGDVNGDGFDDMLVGAAGGSAALLLGAGGAWLAQVDPAQDAAVSFSLAAGGSASGVGDVNGDGRADFAVAAQGSVRVYAGSDVFARAGRAGLPAPIATFGSADANPRLAPLGDIDGDGRADFAFGSGGSAQFVRGGTGAAPALAFTLGAQGILAGLGDINADGRADFALGAGGGAAQIYHGAAGGAPPPIAATLQRVAALAPALLGAGSDCNCDRSADLLALPTAAPAAPAPNQQAAATAGELPPLVDAPPLRTEFGFALPGPVSATSVVVDDDYCAGCPNDGFAFGSTAFNSIQSAIDAVPAGAQLTVMPGVYGPFNVGGKNNLTVAGFGGRTGAESVFVDGGGGDFAARVTNATGVRISGMLLRNARVGVDLVNAGVGGSAAGAGASRIRLDRLIIHSFGVAGLQMTRNSTADVRRLTLVAQSTLATHFNIVGAADPATPPNKLAVAETLVVAPPTNSPNFTWFTPSAPLADFTQPANPANVMMVGDNGPFATNWTPPANQDIPRSAIGFRDEGRNVYAPQRAVDYGYTAGMPYVALGFVSPDYESGLSVPRARDVEVFRSIQAAINAGLKRIVLTPGIYREALILPDGVELIGAGAAQTAIELPAGLARPALQADGARAVRLSGLTVVAPGGTALQARAGAQLVFQRGIVRGSATAVALDGAATDVTLLNLTVVRNRDGVAATGNAPIRVRNSVFAGNSGAALSVQGAAVRQNQYNAYSANGADLRVDGAAGPPNGPGEVVGDPRFNNPAGDDFRPAAGSLLIDAGSPGDPTPAGSGGRVDIGYAESSLGAYYVSPSYCLGCDNDGLAWGVSAFSTIREALGAAGAERAALCGASAGCSVQLDVSVAPGTYSERVVVPSGVRLLGSGAETTAIDGQGESPVRLLNAALAEVHGFTLRGGTGANAAGVFAQGGEGLRVERNLVAGNAAGVSFAGGASGVASFNTIVANAGPGLRAEGASTALAADNSIVAGNAGAGAQALGGATLSVRFSLLNANTPNLAGVADDSTNRLNVDPRFVNPGGGNYALQPGSPAVNAADPRRATGAGGAAPDMGYREVVAAPITLLFGLQGDSCAAANSSVAGVELSSVAVPDATRPITGTLPADGAWQPASLAQAGAPATTWSASVTPGSPGLYRLYSRAADSLGNREAPEVALADRFGEPLPAPDLNLYEGAFYVDGTPPTVTMLTAGASTSAPTFEVSASVNDADPNGRYSVASVYFRVDGAYVPATIAPLSSGPNNRIFRAGITLRRGADSAVVAYALDGAGNLGQSAPITVRNTQNPDPTVRPTTTVSNPLVGSERFTDFDDGSGGPVTGGVVLFNRTTITLRGTVKWTNRERRQLFVDDSGGFVTGVQPVLDDPFADESGWTAVIDLSRPIAQFNFSRFPLRVFAADANGESRTYLIALVDAAAPKFVSTPGPVTTKAPVTLTGAVTDPDGIYVDKVELSDDGGGSWRTIAKQDATPPGNVNTTFSGVYTPTAGLDSVVAPVLLRATDRAGNTTVAATQITVDNVAPLFAPPSFNIAPGSYLDSVQSLTMTWAAPKDGSGSAVVKAAIDRSPTTEPDAVQGGTTLSAGLGADGAWYAHVTAEDALGNRSTYHLGPWYVGLQQLCASPALNVTLDGKVDTAGGEWQASRLLDDDERPLIANPQGGRAQRLYAAWDANAFYLGWQGAQWGVDGTLYAYLSTGAGGTTSLVRPTPGGNLLPFPADMAIVASGPAAGTLYRTVGGGWQPQGQLTVASGDVRESEIRAPFASPLSGATGVRMLAVLLDGAGAPVSVFPTTNPLAGAWGASYSWAPICGVSSPRAGQPSQASVAVRMEAREPASVPYPPGAELRYEITLRNYEQRALPVDLTVDGSSGLGFTALSGDAACASCAPGAARWTISVPSLGADTARTLVVTGRLAANLAGVGAVTATLAATSGGQSLGGSAVVRQVDAAGPSVLIATTSLRPGAQTLSGTADDGAGIGVARVEVSVGGGAWQTAAGTSQWRLPLSVGNVAGLSVQARAVDAYGQVGPAETQQLVVDNQAPQVTLSVPGVVTTLAPLISGTAADPPASAPVAAIEVALNGGFWQPVLRAPSAAATLAGPESWTYSIGSLTGDGVTYRVQARARDEAGNLGQSETKQFVLDNVPPALTVEQAVSEASGSTPPGTLLRGTARDGAGVQKVEVRVHTQAGAVYTETATLSNTTWSYSPAQPLGLGEHSLLVVATDVHGNVSQNGAYRLSVAGAPSVVIGPASAIALTRATLNGTVTPNGAETTVVFQLTRASGDYGNPVVLRARQGALLGASPLAVSADAVGLLPRATYYYRIVATNRVGTATSAEGSFRTEPVRVMLPMIRR